jgi:hypothetical protein
MRLSPLLLLGLCSIAQAQSLSEIREQVRDRLGEVHFAKSFGDLVVSSGDFTFSGAEYRPDDEVATKLTIIGVPFTEVIKQSQAVGLRLEAVAGYARARQFTKDIYNGSAPGFETSVSTTWSTLSLTGGAGPEFSLTDEWNASLLANFGLAYIRNDADYSGPGQATTQAIADGIALNWDGWVGTYGIATLTSWEHALTPEYTLTLQARHDLRWTQTIQSGDSAQDFATRTQILTLRADLIGPTPWTIQGSPVQWRAITGYRRFLEGDLFGSDDFFTVGAALEISQNLPIGSRLSLEITAILADDLTGVGFGFGLEF